MKLRDVCSVIPEGATHMRANSNSRLKGGGLLLIQVSFYKCESGEWLMYTTDPENEYPQWRNVDRIFRMWSPAGLIPLNSEVQNDLQS